MLGLSAEAKPKVVPRKDKAHLVSLVREVVVIGKLLEEEKALEASEQDQAGGSAGRETRGVEFLCSGDSAIRCYRNQ